MGRPKIGITFDFDERLGYFLKADLSTRLLDLGVDLVPLFYEASELDKLKSIDGLLLPGGLCDVDPKRYASKASHQKTKVCKARTDFEYLVLDEFLKAEKPILGICWGFQLLNVYFGGSLIQHLPDERPSNISHEQKEPGHQATHSIRFEENSEGIKLFGSRELSVNSTHHQGVDRLGHSLKLEAKAPDGIVEAFSRPEQTFLWAVQWHPERLENDPVIPAFLKVVQRQG